MNRQAIVGLFTILSLLALFAFFLVLSNFGTGGRYKIGVHFKSAAGLHRGALVYESGVNVGVVDATNLLPEDFTVEVIVAINNNIDIPKDAKFVVAAPLTGDVTLEIVPPTSHPRPANFAPDPNAPQPAIGVLPREILPIGQQPKGTNPATLTDLLEQGQGQVARLDRILAQLETREPALLDTLQSALTNANEISITSNQAIQGLTRRMGSLTDTLSVALNTSSSNLTDITTQLDGLVHKDSGHVDNLFANFDTTSKALLATVDSVRDLAGNKQVRQNLIDVTDGLAKTTQTFASLAGDLRNVTKNPQTQAQLTDTVANIDASTQKLNSLLASLGATSSVYGVDPNATPAPVTSPLPPGVKAAPAASPGAGRGSGVPGGTIKPGNSVPGNLASVLKNRLNAVARNLISVQIRISELDNVKPGAGNTSPLLTHDRGPQTDINVLALPSGRNSLLTGFNDIGSPNGSGTFNFAGVSNLGGGVRIGGGVLYSRLGLLGQFNKGPIGIETRLYDPRHPTLDAYGNLRVQKGFALFGGERDLTHDGRRTVFGLQLQF